MHLEPLKSFYLHIPTFSFSPNTEHGAEEAIRRPMRRFTDGEGELHGRTARRCLTTPMPGPSLAHVSLWWPGHGIWRLPMDTTGGSSAAAMEGAREARCRLLGTGGHGTHLAGWCRGGRAPWQRQQQGEPGGRR